MLTRESYIKKISDTLSLIETSARNRVVLNLYDNNIISEDFFQGFLNLIYDLNLNNPNRTKKNFPGIDLSDIKKEVAFQITSSNTQVKVQNTITKFLKNDFQKSFKELNILIIQPKLKSYKEFHQASLASFDKRKNIKDLQDLLCDINKLATPKLLQICDYFSTEVKLYSELTHVNNQLDDEALKNYRSLIKRKALLDTFYLEGSMKAFEEALVELIRAFSIGLIKNGIEVKPIHRFSDEKLRDELDKIQDKFLGLHNLYKIYVKTGEIDPNYSYFFPRNASQTIAVFDNFREDILKQFNEILTSNGQTRIDFDFGKYRPSH